MLKNLRHKHRILYSMFVAGVTVAILIGLYVIGLFALSAQVPTYQKYWDKKNRHAAPDNAITYIAMGDSTAQGIGATSAEKGYVGLVAVAIAQKTGRPVRLINISKSGAKIEDVMNDQLPQLKQIGVDENTIITIEIGANDVARGFDGNAFKNGMNELLPQLPKQTIISDLPYFGKGRLSSQEKYVKEANQLLSGIADTHGLQLAPLHETTEKNASWLNNALDLFHPSNRGYKNWFNAFWQQLEPTINS